MLAACRLAGLSALEAYYDAVKARAQPMAVGVQKLPVFSLNREPPRLSRARVFPRASLFGSLPLRRRPRNPLAPGSGWPLAGFSASGGFR
jgi:hypothetical protein